MSHETIQFTQQSYRSPIDRTTACNCSITLFRESCITMRAVFLPRFFICRICIRGARNYPPFCTLTRWLPRNGREIKLDRRWSASLRVGPNEFFPPVDYDDGLMRKREREASRDKERERERARCSISSANQRTILLFIAPTASRVEIARTKLQSRSPAGSHWRKIDFTHFLTRNARRNIHKTCTQTRNGERVRGGRLDLTVTASFIQLEPNVAKASDRRHVANALLDRPACRGTNYRERGRMRGAVWKAARTRNALSTFESRDDGRDDRVKPRVCGKRVINRTDGL